MKSANVPLPKESKANKAVQRRNWAFGQTLRFKDQTTKRKRIVLSVTAGHVRGGHSFH